MAAAAAGAPASPVHDENAPDLYIPTMAFITYVLVSGLAKGVLNEFHPDVLVATSSKVLLINLFEIILLRTALYTLAADVPTSLVSPCALASRPCVTVSNAPHNRLSPPLQLDLTALTGYKYVSLVVTTLVALSLGRVVYYFVLAWFGASMAFFVVNTLRASIHRGGALPGQSQSPLDSMLLIVGVCQIVLLWWLGA